MPGEERGTKTKGNGLIYGAKYLHTHEKKKAFLYSVKYFLAANESLITQILS